MNLADYFEQSAKSHADAVYVEEASGATLSYHELAELADRLRNRLVHLGVGPGDRVALCLDKRIDAVASIWGILKAGAAYVPVDATLPARRRAFMLRDCAVKVAIVEQSMAEGLELELRASSASVRLLGVAAAERGHGLAGLLSDLQKTDPAGPSDSRKVPGSSLAYILYTSGSTGRPKGVMVSHRAALSFVNWCVETFSPCADDRFSSHAGFHFDLSILDLYVPVAAGARVVLIPDQVGKNPRALAAFIAAKSLTMWYSTPSVLSLLAQSGDLAGYEYRQLRRVLFAGEVFSTVHLRDLSRQWPQARFYNLYGPTETNVCTYYEVVLPVPPERREAYPIGKACRGVEAIVVTPSGEEASEEAEGELCIRGSTVMNGYWNREAETDAAFLLNGYYRTGDIVVRQHDGNLRFVGRRDRMVKRRGFRVELDEIETCLYSHPALRAAAVVAVADMRDDLRIGAVVVPSLSVRPSIIDLKRYCAGQLPGYAVPDVFAFASVLPKTSTNKTDYRAIEGLVRSVLGNAGN